MNRIAPFITRAVGLYLAWQFAFVMAVLARVDEPQPSLVGALLPAICLGLALHAGLLWAPSTKGRSCWLAAILMIPGALLIFAGAVEEVQLVAVGRMHSPAVAVGYLGGAIVYFWEYGALSRRIVRRRAHVAV